MICDLLICWSFFVGGGVVVLIGVLGFVVLV